MLRERWIWAAVLASSRAALRSRDNSWSRLIYHQRLSRGRARTLTETHAKLNSSPRDRSSCLFATNHSI
jgi:hypothetical protein